MENKDDYRDIKASQPALLIMGALELTLASTAYLSAPTDEASVHKFPFHCHRLLKKALCFWADVTNIKFAFGGSTMDMYPMTPTSLTSAILPTVFLSTSET